MDNHVKDRGGYTYETSTYFQNCLNMYKYGIECSAQINFVIKPFHFTSAVKIKVLT